MTALFFCLFLSIFPYLRGSKYEDAASQYIELISSKPLDMNKIEKMETDAMKKDMTEEFITSMMMPFKNFDKVLYSTEVGKKDGYHIIETAARYKYSIQEYNFAFNIIFGVDVKKKLLQSDYIVGGLTYIYNWTAPSYADTSKFYEIDNVPVGPLSLPGILTLPNSTAKPKGYVLLIQGSGPSDADETYLGMKPFKDIAWGLATKGIAVFRYPKRYNLYKNATSNATIEEEYMIDLEAATDLLYSKLNERILPIAHSEGGKIVPLLTQRKKTKIRGFVTLAGEVEHMIPTTIRQYKYISKVNNHTLTPEDLQNLAEMQKVEDLLEAGELPDDYTLPKILSEFNAAYLNSLYAVDTVGLTNQLDSGDYDFLITNGNKDYQVTIETDFDVWKKNNTNKHVQFKEFDGIDHFQNLIEGTPVPWDYETPQNVFPKIIDTLVEFIESL